MKSNILLLIQLILFSSVPVVFSGLLSGLVTMLDTEPANAEDYANLSCVRTCYRSYNGSCNNLHNPSWGAAGTLFTRLFDSYSYNDGKCELACLANPREISLDFVNIPFVKDRKWTLYTPMLGQLLAHDISSASGVPQTGALAMSCPCVGGKLTKLCPESDRCAPIKIPKWDPYCTPEGIECYDFVRSRSTCNDKCPSVPGEQYNAVTSFIDCSPLYGSNEEQANKLRKFQDGMLNYVMIDDRMYPPQTKDQRICNNAGASRRLCIFAGDARANQNIHIALIQIVLLRYHNKIAKKLCRKINPHWNDEKCYQEARRIVIATFQHITYNEYLPFILGKKNMCKEKLIESNPKGYVDGYDKKVNPSAINEHATAANRIFHSTLAGILKLLDEKRNEHGHFRMSNTFNNASSLLDCNTEMYTAIGAGTQPQLLVDRLHDPEYTQCLFRPQYEKLGEDLFSIDIQRARDHGLAFYPTAMKECGLGNPKSFEDFKYISPKNIEILKRHYKSYDQVELRVAGQLETVKAGQLTGPTFNCIMMKQFHRLKFGDYYWYEFEQKCSFTKDQLKEIRAQTMAKLMCQNAGDFPIQPKAFEVPSSKNKIGPCCDLPVIDLTKWEDCGC